MLIVDFGIKVNPLFESGMGKQEKSIAELQPTTFDRRLYEYDNKSNEMFLIE